MSKWLKKSVSLFHVDSLQAVEVITAYNQRFGGSLDISQFDDVEPILTPITYQLSDEELINRTLAICSICRLPEQPNDCYCDCYDYYCDYYYNNGNLYDLWVMKRSIMERTYLQWEASNVWKDLPGGLHNSLSVAMRSLNEYLQWGYGVYYTGGANE